MSRNGFLGIQVLLILGLGFCAGCTHSLLVSPTTNALTPSPTATVAVSNATAYTPPQADNLLSANLYNFYESQSSNVFFSPFSIITALAMAQEGAAGNTATQMQNVLNLNSNAAIRQQGFQQLINAINDPGKSYTVNTANNLWVQQGFSILPSYINIVQTYYDAGVTNVDFMGNPTGAVQTINGAVSQETEGYIPNLLSSLTTKTRLVLTNAIYFDADWQNPFLVNSTNQQSFTLASGNTESVSMMNEGVSAVIGNFNGAASVIAIPYTNDQASMYIFLPPAGGMSALESVMTGSNLNAWLAANSTSLNGPGPANTIVELSLPKFTFSESYDLTTTLSQMGMPLAFTPGQANFSGIDGTTDLYISQVIHKAFINVDEKGTTAAAATAVIIGIMAGLIQSQLITYIPFVANHPFLFAIVDNATNTVLFMGLVNDPLAN